MFFADALKTYKGIQSEWMQRQYTKHLPKEAALWKTPAIHMLIWTDMKWKFP